MQLRGPEPAPHARTRRSPGDHLRPARCKCIERKEVVVPTNVEPWPHWGEHLQNDEPLARWTEVLLALFAVLVACAIVIGVRAM
jgi:hypothetical protein